MSPCEYCNRRPGNRMVKDGIGHAWACDPCANYIAGQRDDEPDDPDDATDYEIAQAESDWENYRKGGPDV